MRTFDIGDVLSVTTGKLVTRRHIDGIYDILGYMTGENLFTHQLPRALNMCQPALLAQHPELAGVDLPDEIAEAVDPEGIFQWVDGQAERFGRELPVTPLAKADRAPQDPIEELCDMVGPEKVFVYNPGGVVPPSS
jgi:hypothetical protein